MSLEVSHFTFPLYTLALASLRFFCLPNLLCRPFLAQAPLGIFLVPQALCPHKLHRDFAAWHPLAMQGPPVA